jgi:DNA-binding PadR family transcriptional regulator
MSIPPATDFPLSPAAFYTLFALAHDQHHGYAIMQAAKSLSAGSFSMGPATLYTTIGKLVQAGLIEETTSEKTIEERARGRRFYRLTAVGRAALDEELRRMARVVRKAQLKKLIPRNVD